MDKKVERFPQLAGWQDGKDGRVENKMDVPVTLTYVSRFKQIFKDFKMELAAEPEVIMLKVKAAPICLALNAL